MSFVTYRKANAPAMQQASEGERVVTVATILALAVLPFFLAIAFTIWGA